MYIKFPKVFYLFLSGVFLGLILYSGWRVSQSAQNQSIPSQGTPLKTKAEAIISGMVVPHHDLVKTQRSDLFKKVAAHIDAPSTIILVSPNHYNAGQAVMQTTSREWDITAGTITPNKAVVNALQEAGISEEDASFDNEHGIKLILADIKQYFPSAAIVPIIFKSTAQDSDVEKVKTRLAQTCADCFMIASVDFSHYQSALLADSHDNLTLRALQNLDTNSLYSRAEVDSPASLALFAKWAKKQETARFHLEQQTNSGVLAKNTDIETTTHLFGWYEGGEQVKPEASVSFTIGGDMMFGRTVAHRYLADGLWKSLDQLGERLFWGTDVGITNLEGPISDIPVPDDIRPNNLVFNFPPQTIQALAYIRVNAVSLANNHTANQGKKGLETTRRLLDEATIKWIGGPGDSDVDKTGCFTGEVLKLCIIGVHTLASIPNLTPVIQSLKQDPNTRVLIIPHWGNEYIYKHSSSQAKQAHSWIDAGADIVIGAHPHVIQDSELYKGKPIIYSLGNLLFDQDFSKETQQGLVMSGEFTSVGLRLFSLPIQATKYKPVLMKGEAKKLLIDRLYEPFAALKQTTPSGEILFFPMK